MNKTLEKFVIESYNRIKKQKKSPKNFSVRLYNSGALYLVLSTVGLPNNCMELGKLSSLYDEVSQLSDLVDSLNGVLEEEKSQPLSYIAPSETTGSYVSEIDPVKIKGNYSVYLSNYNGNKLAVLKEVKVATGLGLREAKELIDNTPTIVLSNIDQITATNLVSQITKVGGTANIVSQIYINNDGSRVFTSVYDNFSLAWLPSIRRLMRAALIDENDNGVPYNDLLGDDGDTPIFTFEQYNNIISWLKNNN